MDLTEAEDFKKRWQEYMDELYKKDFYNPDNHDGVITQLTIKAALIVFHALIQRKNMHTGENKEVN